MAQVAYSRLASPGAAYPAQPDRGAGREAFPRGARAPSLDAYAEVPPARAPYPGAMRRARRRARLTAAAAVAAAALAGWAALTQPGGRDPARLAGAGEAAPAASVDPAPGRGPAPRAADLAWMLDPTPALGAAAVAIGRAAPPEPAFRVAASPAVPEPSPELSPAVREIARRVAGDVASGRAAGPGKSGEKAPGPVRVAVLDPTPAAVSPARAPAPEPVPGLVPLPVARPPELRAGPPRPSAAPAGRVAARTMPRTRDVFRAAMAEEPSFFEKLFGVGAAAPRDDARPPRQALAYASPDAPPPEAPRVRLSPAPSPATSPSAGTAVYDITARTVTLPSGEVLEAHSGLGAYMDDPRYVHLRMRGSTPPATYELTERERLFHGVRAIRLTPVGGSGAIHGRDGLLAHTYMLRQPGASNGCVSFRDYDRFLQAYLRGEVRRLVVVAGGRGDSFLGRIGMNDRADDRADDRPSGRPRRRG